MSAGSTIGHYRVTARLGKARHRSCVPTSIRNPTSSPLRTCPTPSPPIQSAWHVSRVRRCFLHLSNTRTSPPLTASKKRPQSWICRWRAACWSRPSRTALDYARQIAAGVSAAHQKGIVHRDLKPVNIKITPNVLCTFSISAWLRRVKLASAASAGPDVSPTETLTVTVSNSNEEQLMTLFATGWCTYS